MNYRDELNNVGRLLIKNHHTVSIAESVTSGLVQNVFSTLDNAGLFYEGGITAYNIRQKISHLYVEPVHALSTNCVSEIVAGQMALGVSRSFKTTWGLAITGYASAVPQKGILELFACYAICFDNQVVHGATITVAQDSPEMAQHLYMLAVVKSFVACCSKYEVGTDHGMARSGQEFI